MSSYKGINFPKGFKTSFGKFQKDFANHKCFLDIPHKDKEAEMKKAFDILNDHSEKNPSTSEKNPSDKKEVKPETTKSEKDGNSEKSTGKSTGNKSE